MPIFCYAETLGLDAQGQDINSYVETNRSLAERGGVKV